MEVVRYVSGTLALAFLIMDIVIGGALYLLAKKRGDAELAGCLILSAIPVNINLLISACVWGGTFL